MFSSCTAGSCTLTPKAPAGSRCIQDWGTRPSLLLGSSERGRGIRSNGVTGRRGKNGKQKFATYVYRLTVSTSTQALQALKQKKREELNGKKQLHTLAACTLNTSKIPSLPSFSYRGVHMHRTLFHLSFRRKTHAYEVCKQRSLPRLRRRRRALCHERFSVVGLVGGYRVVAVCLFRQSSENELLRATNREKKKKEQAAERNPEQ